MVIAEYQPKPTETTQQITSQKSWYDDDCQGQSNYPPTLQASQLSASLNALQERTIFKDKTLPIKIDLCIEKY